MSWGKGKILTVLADIISQMEGMPAREIGPESSFGNDLGIRPLRLVDLAVEAETRFDVTIPDEEIDHFKTVGDLTDYISGRLS